MRIRHRRGTTLLAAATLTLSGVGAAAASAATATTATITGTITDEVTGEPLPGCVIAMSYDDGSGDGEWDWQQGCAGDDGKYSVKVTAGRSYRLQFTAFDHVDEYFDGVDDTGAATSVTAPGVADATLQPALPATGVLRYPDGSPAAGVQVHVVHANGGSSDAGAETDADGAWSLPLLAGSYWVQFWMPEGDTIYTNGKSTRPAKPTLTVTAGRAPAPLKTTIARPATLVAHVVDQAGKPLAGVCVEAESSAKACSGADGTATLAGQPSGRRTFLASTADGSRGAVQKVVTLKRGVTTQVTLRLAPAAVVQGTVVNESGKARTKVCLQLESVTDLGVTSYLDKQKVTCSDSTGKWSVTGIPAGRYRVSFYGDKNHPYVYAPGVAFAADATTIVAKSGTTVDIGRTTAGVGGSVSGVITSPDGKPLAHAWAVLLHDNPGRIGEGGDGMYTAETDANGAYTITNVPQWSVPVMAYISSKPYAFTWTGGATDSASAQKVQVSWGKASTANIQMLPQVSLSITVPGIPQGSWVEFDLVTEAGDAAGFGGGASPEQPTSTPGGLGAGKVKIKATLSSNDPSVQPRSWWYLDATSEATATPVTLAAGKSTALTMPVPSWLTGGR